MQNTHVSVIKPAAPGPVSRSQLTKSDWLKGRSGILWNFLEGEEAGGVLLDIVWILMIDESSEDAVSCAGLIPGHLRGRR